MDKKPYALLEKEFEDLRRLYRSLSAGVEGMNAENANLRAENEIHQSQLVNADNRVDISKGIVANSIAQNQEEVTNLSNEIIALKAENKALKSQLRN